MVDSQRRRSVSVAGIVASLGDAYFVFTHRTSRAGDRRAEEDARRISAAVGAEFPTAPDADAGSVPPAAFWEVEDGTPFFALRREAYEGRTWDVGDFRKDSGGPALLVYFDLTPDGMVLRPSESAAYFHLIWGDDAQRIFDATPKR